MVVLELMFTNVLDHRSQAHVFNALLAYGDILAAAARQRCENGNIRQISNPANVFAPYETFGVSFECQIALFVCQGYLRRSYNNYGHIMTLNKPNCIAQDIVV
ncbi:hypothetical protein I4U23_026931 [Adineta vaga]|nr:hypothetical protein I4U23_026931 [Adineta vaga]